jgi:nucleotide-binding universal stress UspA family protein
VFRSVLVAYDGSVHSARALAEAVDLVRATAATLTIMVSVPDSASWAALAAPSAGADIQALVEESTAAYRSMLDEAVDSLPEGVEAATVVAHGPPGPAIVEQIAAGSHDLVVMGSRGRGEVSSFVLGSVSHHVLHSGRAAVLVVRGARAQAR